jgi:hypothetical protein
MLGIAHLPDLRFGENDSVGLKGPNVNQICRLPGRGAQVRPAA